MGWIYDPGTGMMVDDGADDPNTAPFVATNSTNPNAAPYVANPYTPTDKTNLYDNSGYAGDTGPANTGSDGHLYNVTDPDLYTKLSNNAAASGVDSSVIDSLLKSAKGAFGDLSKWVKDNPDLAKMMGLGISTAQQQQNAKELATLKNQWSIDATNAANARADQLWQRRNDSITGAKPANLGIIGQALIDPSVYAKK